MRIIQIERGAGKTIECIRRCINLSKGHKRVVLVVSNEIQVEAIKEDWPKATSALFDVVSFYNMTHNRLRDKRYDVAVIDDLDYCLGQLLNTEVDTVALTKTE